jgi:hypothetical protein
MRTLLRFLIFILAFQMEIRVRAEAPLMQEPVHCLSQKTPCVIQAAAGAFHFKSEHLSLHATPKSVLAEDAENSWRYLSGNLWVEKSKNLKMHTIYADLTSERGSFWLVENEGKLFVRNVNADLVVQLRDGKKLNVPEGFEFWIGGINSLGRSEFGMIRPIDIKQHLALWNELYQGDKEDFVAEVKEMKQYWGDLVARSGDIYKNQVQRKLASIEDEKQSAKEKKRREEAHKAKVRELYRQRVFER